MEKSLYDRAGKEPGLRRMVAAWYHKVRHDPLLKPLFAHTDASHIDALTAYVCEVFGGPARFSGEQGGYSVMFARHMNLAISEDQRKRFVDLFIRAADETGLPADRRLRDALILYLDFGSEVAKLAHLHGRRTGLVRDGMP